MTTIAPRTRRDYLTQLHYLKNFAALNQPEVKKASDVDMTLVAFFEELFLKLLAPSEGSETLARSRSNPGDLDPPTPIRMRQVPVDPVHNIRATGSALDQRNDRWTRSICPPGLSPLAGSFSAYRYPGQVP